MINMMFLYNEKFTTLWPVPWARCIILNLSSIRHVRQMEQDEGSMDNEIIVQTIIQIIVNYGCANVLVHILKMLGKKSHHQYNI